MRAELDSVHDELRAFGDYVASLEAQVPDATDAWKAAMIGPLLTLTNGVSLGVAYRDWLTRIEGQLEGGSLTAELLLADLRAQLPDTDSSG